jgi:leader peptidase (prepilin peptidase) / N-methyltransferase
MTIGVIDPIMIAKAAFGCLLFAITLIMALIDVRQMILPNRHNALFAAGGLAQAVLLGHPNLTTAVLGAVLGFVVLSATAIGFRHVRGIDGLGWDEIAPMLLIASSSALVFVLVQSARKKLQSSTTRLPFGPFLGLGTMMCWLIAVAPGS